MKGWFMYVNEGKGTFSMDLKFTLYISQAQTLTDNCETVTSGGSGSGCIYANFKIQMEFKNGPILGQLSSFYLFFRFLNSTLSGRGLNDLSFGCWTQAYYGSVRSPVCQLFIMWLVDMCALLTRDFCFHSTSWTVFFFLNTPSDLLHWHFGPKKSRSCLK